MVKQTFYLDNDTGTMSDALKAVGFAETVYVLLDKLGLDAGGIIIEDRGGYHTVTIPTTLDVEMVKRIEHPFVAGQGQAFVSATKGADLEEDLPRYDYDERTKSRSNYFEQLKKLSPSDRARYNKDPNDEEFAGLRRLRPNADLDLYIYINHLRAADAYNRLLRQWRGQRLTAFHVNLELLLTLFSSYPNNLANAERFWRQQVDAGVVTKVSADANGQVNRLQLLNPVSGKGNNAYKANGLNIGGIDGFWLLEYLKFVGLFTISTPRIVRRAKDRKTYVLRPVRVERDVLRNVMRTFRASMLTTNSLTLDILAVLRFTRAFTQYVRDALIAGDTTRLDPLLALVGAQPRVTDIASGFDITFYKDMGSAYATMNQATINLPRWAPPIGTPEQADAFLGLLREHELVIAGIKTVKGDEGSDEIELLRRYRDFLSGHDAALFFEFAAHYGGYYLGKRHTNQYAGQFTTDGIELMEELMAQVSKKDKPLQTITQNEGFRSLAGAIRRATVLAQYHAAREKGYPFEVRYGLGQELLRSAAYPKDFLAALSIFVHNYNAENARIGERITKQSLANIPRNRRASIRLEHLDDIVQLVDDHGSDLICKMLVAYGYARDSRLPGVPDAAGIDTGDDLEDEQSA